MFKLNYNYTVVHEGMFIAETGNMTTLQLVIHWIFKGQFNTTHHSELYQSVFQRIDPIERTLYPDWVRQ